MSRTALEMTDVTIHGSGTHLHGVKAVNVESRPWIADFPVCRVLNQHRILHVGIQEAVAPTRIVRTKQTTTYFLACYEGKGKVLIDGRWRICRRGLACLLPAHTLNAFEAIPGVRWKFCWVCYQFSAEQRPTDTTSPVMARFDALPLRSAILGLMSLGSVQDRNLGIILSHQGSSLGPPRRACLESRSRREEALTSMLGSHGETEI